MPITGGTNYEIFDNEDEFFGREFHSKNYHVPKGIHIMNKNEHKALRRLKQETGLTEEELRKEKTYCKILSEAQKAKGPKTDTDRAILMLVKRITRELKLPVEHYKVKDAIDEVLNTTTYYSRIFRDTLWPMSADSVIRVYLNIRKKQKK